jgi:hypothetical protein
MINHLKTSRNPSMPSMRQSIRIRSGQVFTKLVWCGLGILWLTGCLGTSIGWAAGETDLPLRHIRAVIPILGTTKGEEAQPVGIVAEIILDFTHRRDHEGLQVIFETAPGKFSLFAQESVIRAIHHVVAAAQLNPDSWTVRFSLPYPGVTLYGESLSAMAALNVVALAKNEPVADDTVMTGTVTAEGSLGVVGGVPLKIRAAYQRHYRKVVIPDELDVADGDWETPFLMEVTPVRSIHTAYFALTHRTLHPPGQPQAVAASLVR